MNKTILSLALSSVGVLVATSANADLAAKAMLNFDAGQTGGNYGFIVSGSYFAMDTNGNGAFSKAERTGISQSNGLALGTTQAAGDIDSAWSFFSNNGNHFTDVATTVSNASGNTADIDFSGWSVFWNGIDIPMGAGTSGGVASVVCDVDCADGDGYTLDYFATVPTGDPSGFGDVSYTVHLEGTVGADQNLAPVATLDPLVTALFLNTSVVIDLAGNVSDPDGDGVDNTSFQIIYTGSRSPVPTITDDGSGMITYTDNQGTDTAVPDTFTYTVADSLGKVSATFAVNVNVATVIAPIANPFSVDTDVDVAGTADVVANATDVDGTVDATTVVVSNLVNLQSALPAPVTGIVAFTPVAGFTGIASFDYTVDDNDGATSNVATVTINVNAAPVANDDAANVDRNSSVIIDVLANDTDSDGTVDNATVIIAMDVASGTTTVDGAGVVTYTPTPNTGSLLPDSFTYTVKDNKGLISNIATVAINVNNATPVAVDDTATIDVGTDATVSVDVTANDADSDGTIDDATIVVTGAIDGTAVVNAGNVDFTPDNGFIGSASFTYTVQDTDAAVSNEGNVVVSVSSGVGVLPVDAVLSINPVSIAAEDVNKLPPPGAGSWFNMEVNPGILTYTALNGFNGITLGTTQAAVAANPDIDAPWSFFGNLGVSQTIKPIVILTDDGAGNVTLDQSGWDISWNDIPNIALNTRAHTPGFTDGVSKMTCANDCSIGDTFILEYSTTVPDGDISGFGNVKYFLHLEGAIFAEGTRFIVGGCNTGAMNVVTDSRAVDSNCQSVTVAAGSTADAVGNAIGNGLTAEDIGLKDPKLNIEDGKQCIGGCVDFIIENVTPGGFVDVVFKLSETIPQGGVYRKLLNGVWVDFDVAFGDKIGSAASVDTGGDCLGPEDEYQSGLREGSDCLFMRITDNGPNDADPTEGTIADPSGILVAGSPNAPAGSSSSGCSISSVPVTLNERADWMIVAAFLGLMGMLKYRRRNNL